MFLVCVRVCPLGCMNASPLWIPPLPAVTGTCRLYFSISACPAFRLFPFTFCELSGHLSTISERHSSYGLHRRGAGERSPPFFFYHPRSLCLSARLRGVRRIQCSHIGAVPVADVGKSLFPPVKRRRRNEAALSQNVVRRRRTKRLPFFFFLPCFCSLVSEKKRLFASLLLCYHRGHSAPPSAVSGRPR